MIVINIIHFLEKDGQKSPVQYNPRIEGDNFILDVVFYSPSSVKYERQLVMNINENTDKVFKLVLKDKVEPFEMLVIPIMDYYIRENDIKMNITYPDIYLGRLIIEKTGEITLHCAYALTPEENKFKYINIDESGKSSTGLLVSISETFAKKFEKSSIKQNLINDIDIYDSVSYLEAQVDTLTRLVNELIMMNSQSPTPALVDILRIADSHSVLDIKSKEKIEKEFENKKHIRELQGKYYEQKTTD